MVARALCITIPDDRGDESFADDLNMGRGIVSGRVALLLRSTEIRPHRPNDLLPPLPLPRFRGPLNPSNLLPLLPTLALFFPLNQPLDSEARACLAPPLGTREEETGTSTSPKEKVIGTVSDS